jgi:hypothetical protein
LKIKLTGPQDSHSAQVASIDQQRHIMQYIRDLNGWLEQEVADRRQRLDDIVTLVDQLGEEVRNIRAEG